ncbi:hypothetical protein B0T24DRAFT_201704 [Lasiosphaeria ovina]|uniref:Uncharacterized protein n=1 Tax=Lasiosphaeria ovina TaxID=92902 RepID=A0AAE0JRS8_9PEZI|nr:hypothetical protein B0T24DRAFT_201704 [Lasiosphaeria ovina]
MKATASSLTPNRILKTGQPACVHGMFDSSLGALKTLTPNMRISLVHLRGPCCVDGIHPKKRFVKKQTTEASLLSSQRSSAFEENTTWRKLGTATLIHSMAEYVLGNKPGCHRHEAETNSDGGSANGERTRPAKIISREAPVAAGGPELFQPTTTHHALVCALNKALMLVPGLAPRHGCEWTCTYDGLTYGVLLRLLAKRTASPASEFGAVRQRSAAYHVQTGALPGPYSAARATHKLAPRYLYPPL